MFKVEGLNKKSAYLFGDGAFLLVGLMFKVEGLSYSIFQNE